MNARPSAYLTPTMFDIKLLNFMFKVFVNFVDPFHIIRKLMLAPATNRITKWYEENKGKIWEKFDESQGVMLRFFALMSIGFLLFCGAILMYVLFHILYMPASTHVKPVHMQFNKICDDKMCGLNGVTSSFHSFPIAHLQLSKNQLMMVGQPYHIYVRLDLPETPRNQDLGIFMICVDMKDKDNMLKSQACRSTMLRYRSPLLQKIKTFLLIPFYIFGLHEEKQNLDVEMFSKYIDTTNSVTDIYVEIQSKVVEFYGVTLQITAHFTGLRYIIFHFPIISACVGTAINFFTLVIITLLLWYHYDYEMDWVEDARKSFTGAKPTENKSSLNASKRKLFNDDRLELDGDDLLFYGDDEGDKVKNFEE